MSSVYFYTMVAGVALTVGIVTKKIIDAIIFWSNPISRKIHAFKIQLEGKKEARKKEESSIKNLLIGAATGAAVGIATTWGTRYCIIAVEVCAGIGVIVALFVKKTFEDANKLKKMKELAVLYESVVFYSSAGYTLQQSIARAAELTPVLRPALSRCLAAWIYGPIRALNAFGGEVDLPEAEIMASIFAHVEEKGIKFGEGAIEEEANSLENLRQTLSEMKIMSKPLYFAVYRALPLLAVSGIVVGALIYRVIIMLTTLIM